MPIVVVPGGGPPPPAPPAGGVPTRRVVEPPGVYQAVWYPPDGSEALDLNPAGQDWWSLKANAGLGTTPVDLITTESPDAGVNVEAVRPRERTVLWPMRVRSQTHLGLLTAWRHLVDKITQTDELGPGRLQLRRPDGTAREILARYVSGLEGEPDDGTWLQVTAVINLLCPDPYWRDTRTITVELRDEPEPDYLDPYPSIASGRTLGAVDLANPGHREVWPDVRIRGPMTSITATNTARGEAYTLTHALEAGETVTITGRPLQVRGDAGDNLVDALGLLDGGGKPWRLDARRTSRVVLSVAGSVADSEPGANDGTRLWLTYPVFYKTA